MAAGPAAAAAALALFLPPPYPLPLLTALGVATGTSVAAAEVAVNAVTFDTTVQGGYLARCFARVLAGCFLLGPRTHFTFGELYGYFVTEK